jgi:hypothetical protein
VREQFEVADHREPRRDHAADRELGRWERLRILTAFVRLRPPALQHERD